MSNTQHLYPVASSAGGDEPRVRTPRKIRPKYPVPTDRMTHENAVKALRAFCILSKGGGEPVDSEQLGQNLGLSAATAGLNNAFFVDVDLLTRVGRGSYLPTDVTLRFNQRYSFAPETAAKAMAPYFANTWFYEAVKNRLAISPGASRDSVIETLAGVAETDAEYKVQLGMILEWLEFVGLITMSNGIVALVEDDDDSDASPNADPALTTPPTSAVTPTVPEPTTEVATGGSPMVNLSVSLTVTAEDLALLTQDQIDSLFEGIAKIAKAKAVLNKV